jgi:hypothetical protein
MDGLTAALSTIGVLVGLLVVAATVVAFFRANYAKATIDTLRDSNTALTERVKELEAENGRQAVKIAHLEDEAVALRSYVSGTEAVARLEQKFDHYHGELTEHRGVVTERLDAIAAAVGAKGRPAA